MLNEHILFYITLFWSLCIYLHSSHTYVLTFFLISTISSWNLILVSAIVVVIFIVINLIIFCLMCRNMNVLCATPVLCIVLWYMLIWHTLYRRIHNITKKTNAIMHRSPFMVDVANIFSFYNVCNQNEKKKKEKVKWMFPLLTLIMIALISMWVHYFHRLNVKLIKVFVGVEYNSYCLLSCYI